MTKAINTIAAYRSLLQEDEDELKQLGVEKLLRHVRLHWTDIANDINLIESLYDDEAFHNRPLVAILLARLYFYLTDYDEALRYALLAGEQFDITAPSDDFTEILVNKCIEKYIESCNDEQRHEQHALYQKVVDHVLQSSLANNDYKLPLGISLDTQDRPLFEKVLKVAEFNELVETLLPHLLRLEVDFRGAILGQVVERMPAKFATSAQYLSMLQLLQVKGDNEAVSKLIYDLVRGGEKETAFMLALEVSEMHGFSRRVLEGIPIEEGMEDERRMLSDIIEGEFACKVNSLVLQKQARTDPHYLAMLKKIEAKYSISHGAAIMGLSLLQSFTQDEEFLNIKENLEWAAKSTHWNKFTSISSLGLIHRNTRDKAVFRKFLPENNSGDGVNHYSNGGALYGLGLLYTGTNNQTIIDYILEKTTNPTLNSNEVVMHGACLGLGLTAFASGHEAAAERMKDIVRSSTSVMGEASALALGLIYAGTNNEAILSELIGMAAESQHEKVIRSISLSIGLICYGSPSWEWVQSLEENPAMKLAVPFYLACAYFKTSNPKVVRKLLKLSNDISNEVKRAAIMALGFVLYQDEKLTAIIKMLLYSYNPFIRYACIMALAVGSRPTKEVLELIWPSLTDSVDYVRQGSYIALALLLQVSTNQSEPKLADLRKSIQEVLSKPHGDQMTKLGAILAIGLLDIGGRNMSVSLTTRSGMPKLQAITGMLIFTQYWNWFPYINFIGLAVAPSMFIGVTSKLYIPTSFTLHSNCKPSLFDYPPNIPKQQKKNNDKKEAAKELSTTNKVKARLAKKKDSQIEIEVPQKAARTKSLLSNKDGQEAKEEKELKESKAEQKPVEKKQEETSSVLNNPCRIAQKQRQFISFQEGRYTPILPTRKMGISFLRDNDPLSDDEYLNKPVPVQQEMKPEQPLNPVPEQGNEEDQLNPPEEFEYDDEKEKLVKQKPE